MKLKVLDLGNCGYGKALDMQYDLLDKRQKGELGDTLILVEHPPVITLGRHAVESNIVVPGELLKEKGIEVYRIERGGDVTYHGPGQLVGYPIVGLRERGIGIREFVERLQNTFISLLKEEYGIDSGINPEFPGVWTDDGKITAVGLAVKRGVTMHGFAFNINTNLEHFKLIVPCGISGRGVTSLEKLRGEKSNFSHVKVLVTDYFCRLFGYDGSEGLSL